MVDKKKFDWRGLLIMLASVWLTIAFLVGFLLVGFLYDKPGGPETKQWIDFILFCLGWPYVLLRLWVGF